MEDSCLWTSLRKGETIWTIHCLSENTRLVATLHFPVIFSVLITLASSRSRLACPPAAAMKLSRKSVLCQNQWQWDQTLGVIWSEMELGSAWVVQVLWQSWGSHKCQNNFTYILLWSSSVGTFQDTSGCLATDLSRPCFANSSPQKKGGKFVLHFFFKRMRVFRIQIKIAFMKINVCELLRGHINWFRKSFSTARGMISLVAQQS